MVNEKESNKSEILKRLKKRKNFNTKLLDNFKKIQLPLDFKKKKSEDINSSNYILCTGLFDDYEEDLNYYIKLLKLYTINWSHLL